MSCWLNGQFVEPHAQGALISPFDRGFLFGHGVFETVGIVAGEAPLWSAHERRLLRAARRLALPGVPPRDLEALVLEVAARKALADPIVRVTWTAGVEGVPTFCIAARPRVQLARAVRLVAASEARAGADPLSDVKHVSRAVLELGAAEARAAGADDAVFLDRAGNVLETSTGNLLWLAEGEWRTPDVTQALLPGIARALLLAGLAARGTPAREGTFTFAQMAAADELFVTNAVYGPRPARLLGDPEPVPEPEHPLLRLWQRLLASAAG